MEPLPLTIQPETDAHTRNKMIQSDALSRHADLIGDKDRDNKNISMLPNEMFIRFTDMDLKDLFLETTRLVRCPESNKGKQDSTDEISPD